MNNTAAEQRHTTALLLLFVFAAAMLHAQSNGIALYRLKKSDTASFHLLVPGDMVKVIYTGASGEETELTGYLSSVSEKTMVIDAFKVIDYSAVREMGFEVYPERISTFHNLSLFAGAASGVSLGFLIHEWFTHDIGGTAAARAMVAAAVAVPAAVLFTYLAHHKYHMYKFDRNTFFTYAEGADYERWHRRQFLKDIGVKVEK